MSWLSEFLSASPKKKRKVAEKTPENEEEEEDTNLSSILDMISGSSQGERHPDQPYTSSSAPMQELNSRAIKFLLSKFLGAK